MKYLSNVLGIILFLLTCNIFQSCLKNNLVHTQTYTIETPVFKNAKDVIASLKNDQPRPIKSAGKILLFGKYLFVNEIDKGIHIIDNSNPSSPQNISFIEIPGNRDLAIKNNTLYADLYSDLIALNITDLENIKVVKILPNVFPNRYYSTQQGDTFKILCNTIRHDTTITVNGEYNNIGFLGRPQGVLYSDNMVSGVPQKSAIAGSMATFALSGNYLYTVNVSEMNVFKISSANDPVFNNKINVGWDIETIFPFKDKLFLGSQNGMYIFDISTMPASPSNVGTFAHVRSCDPVIADENFAYVTLHSGTQCSGYTNELDIIKLNYFADNRIVKVYSLNSPRGLAKDGNLLFICDGTAGLKIYEAGNVQNIQLIQNLKGFEAADVILDNQIALVMASDGLYQFDYADLNHIHLLSKIQILN